MTIDVVLKKTNFNWDILLSDSGDILTDNFFDTSLQYSLLGEKRASASEVAISQYRRGWIGNIGRKIKNSSKIWLFEQSRYTRSQLNGIRDAAIDSLNWLITEGYVKDIQVSANVVNNAVLLAIQIFRFNSSVDVKYFELWQNTGA